MDKMTLEQRRAFRDYRKQKTNLGKLAVEFGLSEEEICKRLGVPMPQPPTLKLSGQSVVIPIDTAA